MSSRSSQLRRRHRRIVGWSLGVAVLAHAALFLMSPSFSRTAWELERPADAGGAQGVAGMQLVDVTFGPPEIRLEDGTVRQEPPERVLQALSVNVDGTWLGPECQAVRAEGIGFAEGAIRLQVESSGRISRTEVAQSSGDPCRDRVLEEVARSLRYHWLPDAEAPAPVDVNQPVRAESVRD